LREHLREIRRVASETHQEVIDTGEALGGQLARIDALLRDQAAALPRIEARLEDLARPGQATSAPMSDDQEQKSDPD
jgi:hypothetical protein